MTIDYSVFDDAPPSGKPASLTDEEWTLARENIAHGNNLSRKHSTAQKKCYAAMFESSVQELPGISDL
jgi:hypothetical protein